MQRKKKHNWNELQKLTPININEKNLCQDSSSITVLIKMRYASIEIVFNRNGKKEFCFCSLV